MALYIICVLLERGHWRRKNRGHRGGITLCVGTTLFWCQPSGSCALAHTQTRDGETKQYTGKKREKSRPARFLDHRNGRVLFCAYMYIYIYIGRFEITLQWRYYMYVVLFFSLHSRYTYIFVCICASARVWENIALAGRQEVSMYVARARV